MGDVERNESEYQGVGCRQESSMNKTGVVISHVNESVGIVG